MKLNRLLHERAQLVRLDGVKLDGDFAEVLRPRARGLKPRRAYASPGSCVYVLDAAGTGWAFSNAPTLLARHRSHGGRSIDRAGGRLDADVGV